MTQTTYYWIFLEMNIKKVIDGKKDYIYLGNLDAQRDLVYAPEYVEAMWMMLQKDEPEDYYLLGPIEFELDLYPLVVTHHSPFGQAIIGKKINDTFNLEIRGQDTKFTIIAIEKVDC